MNAPANDARVTPSASTTIVTGAASIRVAPVEVGIGLVLDLDDRDVVGGERRHLVEQTATRIARARRPQHDEPRRRGLREVGAVDLLRYERATLRGRSDLLAPIEHPRNERGDDDEYRREQDARGHGPPTIASDREMSPAL